MTSFRTTTTHPSAKTSLHELFSNYFTFFVVFPKQQMLLISLCSQHLLLWLAPKVKWSVNKGTLRTIHEAHFKEIRFCRKENAKKRFPFQQRHQQMRCSAGWHSMKVVVIESIHYCRRKLRPYTVLCSCTINCFVPILLWGDKQLLFLSASSLTICSFPRRPTMMQYFP